MELDDGGHCVVPVAYNGSLIIVHDGLYIPYVNEGKCSAAVVLLCTTTMKITMKLGTVYLCEKMDHKIASNYRGEILVGIITSYTLNAVNRLNPMSSGAITCYCYNLGVIHHANNLSCPLPEKHTQTDVLLNLYCQLASVPFMHVQSHQDVTHSIDDLQSLSN